ncbi:dTMP kinase [Candidatus Berkelbacteria bacterium]|nr:dTMP kinase [Candidatus Berkelbacteria bacterium]
MPGKFIVIDGVDGTGKQTQSKVLRESLEAKGLKVAQIDFPGYERNLSGRELKKYLRGDYGGAVHPKLASYLFAVDRYEDKDKLKNLIAENDIVIADRYIISNIAYQSAKLPKSERAEFRDWLSKLEYDILGAYREDLVVFFSLSERAWERLLKKRATKTGKARDIYEKNQAYLKEVFAEYKNLCKIYDHWRELDCGDGENIRSVASIAQDLESLVLAELELETA